MWLQEIFNQVFDTASNRLKVLTHAPDLEDKIDDLNNKITALDAAIDAIKTAVEGTLTTQLSESIPEYAWFTGAEQPTPADQTKFAWGYELDETTGEISAYGWAGAAWVKVVI